jgi:hypothetical protein
VWGWLVHGDKIAGVWGLEISGKHPLQLQKKKTSRFFFHFNQDRKTTSVNNGMTTR